MGNEASRPTPDGLTPRGYAPGSTPTSLASPRTPTSSPGSVRRAKSFSSSASSTSAEPPPGISSASQAMDKTIQRMDKTIRKRVRGGITYNMKIILRGDRATGKTALFHRLKGLPIPTSHEPTPQLQSATINWSFRANSEESVKCDVWDVVDKGFTVANGDANGSGSGGNGDSAANTNPFEGSGGAQTSGAHPMAAVDASTVDVYHETHGVVFLLDVTKPHTLEYVRQHLDQVPVHIPTLVLGNFRDCGAQRKIFKEDIQELLYGGGSTSSRPLRRPQELLYFECSLLNCYGLKALHQYLGIPFLQLKQQTIRQQLRIVEGEFAHLKHDLQAKITEQRYAEYLEHIKATGSDIRTGRRVSGGPSGSLTNVSDVVTATVVEDESPKPLTRLDRTQSSSSDIVVGTAVAACQSESPASEMPELPTPATSMARQVDLDDLPERAAALALQAGNALKIDYSEAEQRQATKPAVERGIGSESNTVSPSARPADEAKPTESVKASKPKTRAEKSSSQADPKKASAPVKAEESVMNLEDFQVPKARYNELDDFYSDENSDEDAGDDDEDVVVGPSGGRRLVSSASAKYSHKQLFLESDDSDSDGDVEGRLSRGVKKKDTGITTQLKKSPRRQNVTKPTAEEPPAVVSTPPTPCPPNPTRASPPSAPSPRAPVTPQVRMSPQHSPRRRVKEPVAVVTVDESAAIDVPVAVANGHDQQAVGPNDASITEGSIAIESAASTPEVTDEDEREETRVEQEETSERQTTVEPVGESVAAAPLSITPAVEENGVEHDVVVPEVDEAGEDDALDALVKTTAKSKDLVEDDDLVVAGDAGEMDSFFSDNDDGEEKSNGVEKEDLSNECAEIEANVSVEAVEIDYEGAKINSPSVAVPAPVAAPADSPQKPQRALLHSSDSDTTEPGINSPHTSVVAQMKQQHKPIALALSDDDSDEGPSTAKATTKPSVPSSEVGGRPRKVEMLLSDDDDSDAWAPATQKPLSSFAPIQKIRESDDTSLFPSPPFAPMAASKSGNLLEDFLNDSGSDSDTPARPPIASKRFGANIVNREHDEEDEDEDDGRFAAYDAKKSEQRTSRALRKQQREEIQMLSSTTISTSTSRTSSFSNTSESGSRTGSFVNQDVLAAIRAAEQDALRMLEASTPVAKAPKSTTPSDRQVDEEVPKKKKKSSSRHKSSRDEDGGEEEKIKKPKKKKDREASPSSKSKRREMILTDEDE